MASDTTSTPAVKPATGSIPSATADKPVTETKTPDPKTTTGSGRTVHVDTAEDAAPPLNAEVTDAPIGTVEDALKSHVPTIAAPKEDASKKERSSDTEQPILSLAALRDYHNKRGTAPSTEQVEQVRQLEKDIAEEGGKKQRTNPIEKGK